MFKINYYLLLFIPLAVSCRFPKFEKPGNEEEGVKIPDYGILFYEINDTVTVKINDRVVFQYNNLWRHDKDLALNIEPYLQPGENKLEMELIDSPHDECPYRGWALIYDIYREGKLIDFWDEDEEFSPDCKERKVLVTSHTLMY